jgi:hypothetical protein
MLLVLILLAEYIISYSSLPLKFLGAVNENGRIMERLKVPLKRLSSTFELNLFCISDKFLLVLASTVILGSESRGTHNHILLSHDPGSLAVLQQQTSSFYQP